MAESNISAMEGHDADGLPIIPERHFGYHLTKIARGEFGWPSKIFEEVEEFRDALEQGATIMALVELSDLIGAIGGYLANHHPSIDIHDLVQMSDITQRAFKAGHREAKS